jgi:hypothetical protein
LRKKEEIIYTTGSQWKQRYVVKKAEDFSILPAEWIVKTKSWQPYHADDWNQVPVITRHKEGGPLKKPPSALSSRRFL